MTAAVPAPIIPLLSYQQTDVESNARLRWDCWARQTGKSFTKSLRRVLRGLRRQRTQVFLSAGERQSRELMAKARQHCQALKIATDFYDDRYFKHLSIKQLEIVLPGGVRIIGLPANPETARGFTGDVLLDEFAMHAEDRDIWGAMFPMLLRGDGELDVASTPRGCGNVFYELRQNTMFDRNLLSLPDAIRAGLQVDADEIRAAIDDDWLYRQEFLCEFLDEAHAFLPYEQIVDCADESLQLCQSPRRLDDAAADLFVGVDIGRHRDLTVMWVLTPDRSRRGTEGASSPREKTMRRGRFSGYRTVAVFELAGAPFREQWAMLDEVLQCARVRRCSIDAGGLGMPLAEQAADIFGQRRVESVMMTPALKSQSASGLRLAVEDGSIAIPADERIYHDWHAVRRSVSASGQFRLSAPRREGSHADRFWAAALAIHAAREALPRGGEVGRVEIKPPAFSRTGIW